MLVEAAARSSTLEPSSSLGGRRGYYSFPLELDELELALATLGTGLPVLFTPPGQDGAQAVHLVPMGTLFHAGCTSSPGQ